MGKYIFRPDRSTLNILEMLKLLLLPAWRRRNRKESITDLLFRINSPYSHAGLVDFRLFSHSVNVEGSLVRGCFSIRPLPSLSHFKMMRRETVKSR